MERFMRNNEGSDRHGAVLYVNIAIIAIAAALYAALVSPLSVMSITPPAGVPVYKASSQNEVSLLCAGMVRAAQS